MSQLVDFKTAKLAREKGYKGIPRIGSIASLYSKDGKHVDYMNYGFQYSGLSDGYIGAPTQSELQTWLRDDKGVDCLVDKWESNYVYSVSVKNKKAIESTSFKNISKGEQGMFTKYEEALAAALINGIDLL